MGCAAREITREQCCVFRCARSTRVARGSVLTKGLSVPLDNSTLDERVASLGVRLIPPCRPSTMLPKMRPLAGANCVVASSRRPELGSATARGLCSYRREDLSPMVSAERMSWRHRARLVRDRQHRAISRFVSNLHESLRSGQNVPWFALANSEAMEPGWLDTCIEELCAVSIF